MLIFNGEKKAKKILSDFKKKIKELKIKPVLAAILIGENKASELYVRLKREAGERIGIKLKVYKFNEKAKEKDIIQKIKELNEDELISGIIVQLPLPKKFNQDRIVKTISPLKDVDGFLKNSDFLPVLPSAIFFALKSAAKSFKNKKVLALVNSEIFGKTLSSFLAERGIKTNYFLRRKRLTPKIKSKIKSADAIITACGVPGLLADEWKIIKKGIILIDAGFPPDVEKENLKEKVSFLTPTPGGIGPLTVALLLKNTYLAAKKYGKNNSSKR